MYHCLLRMLCRPSLSVSSLWGYKASESLGECLCAMWAGSAVGTCGLGRNIRRPAAVGEGTKVMKVGVWMGAG